MAIVARPAVRSYIRNLTSVSNGTYLSFVIARRPDVAIQWELPASQQSNVALRARCMTRLPRFARDDDVVKQENILK